jgi:hypothetical protein
MVARTELINSQVDIKLAQALWDRDTNEPRSMLWQARFNYDSDEHLRTSIDSNVLTMVNDEFPTEPSLKPTRKALHEIDLEEVTNDVFTQLEIATLPTPPDWIIVHEKQKLLGRAAKSGRHIIPRHIPFLMDSYGLVDGNRKSYAEIARECGIAASAVREKVNQARRVLFSETNLRSKVSKPSILVKEDPSSL